LLAISHAALADGFGLFFDQKNLSEKVIVEAGDVKELFTANGLEQTDTVYRINDRCFVITGFPGFWGYGEKAGLLLVDKDKTIEIALLESSIGSVDVKIYPISIVRCR
jgi:hypothetical protein